MTRRGATLMLGALALAGGCIDIDFDPKGIVKGPRVLALSANPPEALFGEDIHFEALVVDETGEDLTERPNVETRWTVCLSLQAILDAAGLGGSTGFVQDCAPEETVVLEPDGAPDRAVLPAAALMEVLSMVPTTPPDEPPVDPGIPGVDPGALRTLANAIAEVGVPLAVRVEIFEDDVLVTHAFKRFAITTRSGATLNPPPPQLMVDGLALSARGGGDPRACVSETGEIVFVEAGGGVQLSPDPLEEPWLETYPVVDLGGNVIELSETAYYSWFSTAGGFEGEVTQRPNRDARWNAPEEPGVYPIWVVVRDGHLGQSWCRFDVEVRVN